jgi:hypothetical protein
LHARSISITGQNEHIVAALPLIEPSGVVRRAFSEWMTDIHEVSVGPELWPSSATAQGHDVHHQLGLELF